MRRPKKRRKFTIISRRCHQSITLMLIACSIKTHRLTVEGRLTIGALRFRDRTLPIEIQITHYLISQIQLVLRHSKLPATLCRFLNLIIKLVSNRSQFHLLHRLRRTNRLTPSTPKWPTTKMFSNYGTKK